jgi:dTMP kinase
MKGRDIMGGKLIVVEGSDASGKATQTLKLFERLLKEGYNVKKISFPNYSSPSSALVKMYLNGEFGSRPGDVNPYAASTFYAADRFASYKKELEGFYKGGGIVVADRYTTSNMVHQASKIEDEKEKYIFLDWLWDFEFRIFGLPVPDAVVFLDVPPEISRALMKERENKFTGEEEKDIHERDYNYLVNSYNTSRLAAERYKWNRVDCVRDGRLKSIEEIHEEAYAVVRKNCL